MNRVVVVIHGGLVVDVWAPPGCEVEVEDLDVDQEGEGYEPGHDEVSERLFTLEQRARRDGLVPA